MSYIEKYFQDMGFIVNQIEPAEHQALVDSFRISSLTSNWLTFFKWSELNNDKVFWHSITGRLKIILDNEIGFNKSTVYDNITLQQFVDTHNPILTPDEKIDNLLEYIRNETSFDGEAIRFHYGDNNMLKKLYFLNKEECFFYVKTAIKKGLLESESLDSYSNYLSLTSDGLSRFIKATESRSSRYCFVAMAFDNELNTIYINAIEPAIIATGFLPIRVDKIHIDSDKTINDEIIAGIKKSRFTIADFTKHKNGVYFEAGYALGKGKKVIYCCREDHLTNAHFDIRNYQHIVWKDAASFKEQLVNKIEAFIID